MATFEKRLKTWGNSVGHTIVISSGMGAGQKTSGGLGAGEQRQQPGELSRGSTTDTASVSAPNPTAGASFNNSVEPQREQTEQPRSLLGRFTCFVKEFSKGLKDLAYVCVAVPKALHDADRKDFYISSVANILRGAQEFARTWAGSVFAGIVISGGDLGAEYLWPCAVTLAATQSLVVG